MNRVMKLGGLSSLSPKFSSSGLSSITTSRKGVGTVRLVHASSGNESKPSNFQNMDKATENHDQVAIHLNVMEESFGEGYATRSDEEGFGGIYGGNDEGNAKMKIKHDPANHDSSQGSEVKEKEKARNQAEVE